MSGATDQIQGWIDEDRELAEAARKSSGTAADQAEAIKWFAGTPDTPEAEKSRMLAQAQQLLEEGAADEGEGKAWDAAADGWQAILDAVNEGVDDPDQH